MAEKRAPLFDYFAAALLVYAVSSMWEYLIFFQPTLILFTILIYIIVGAFATYLVCRRVSNNYLVEGIKVVGAIWLFTVIMMFLNSPTLIWELLALRLICYSIGGIAASYIAFRQRMRSVNTENLGAVTT